MRWVFLCSVQNDIAWVKYHLGCVQSDAAWVTSNPACEILYSLLFTFLLFSDTALHDTIWVSWSSFLSWVTFVMEWSIFQCWPYHLFNFFCKEIQRNIFVSCWWLIKVESNNCCCFFLNLWFNLSSIAKGCSVNANKLQESSYISIYGVTKDLISVTSILYLFHLLYFEPPFKK